MTQDQDQDKDKDQDKEQPQDFYLAFDFGTRRIGVAVGQKLTRTATPLDILEVKGKDLPWAAIKQLITTWKPRALLVGVPLALDGSDDQMTKKARKFIKELHKRYQLPVIGIEERLTTKAARERVFAEGGYKALQKTAIDSLAAKIMLEAWLGGSW